MLQSLIQLREQNRLNPGDPATMIQLAEALVDYVIWCQDQIEAASADAKDLIAEVRALPLKKQVEAQEEATRRNLVGPESKAQLLIDRDDT